MQDYEKRLLIPIVGNDITKFYTKSDSLVATGYKRIVIGKRGPYIEFDESQINIKVMHIPTNQMWRIREVTAFYIERRTTDKSYVKIYFQKKPVTYADYLIGHYYISPFDLKTDNEEIIIKPLKTDSGFSSEKFF